jgi:hypothetical protein
MPPEYSRWRQSYSSTWDFHNHHAYMLLNPTPVDNWEQTLLFNWIILFQKEAESYPSWHCCLRKAFWRSKEDNKILFIILKKSHNTFQQEWLLLIYSVIAANSFGDWLSVFTSLGPFINLSSYLLPNRLPCNKDAPKINSHSIFDRKKLIFNVALLTELRLGLPCSVAGQLQPAWPWGSALNSLTHKGT